MIDPPFDKLPPELLSHILTLAWTSYTEDDSISRFRFPSIPMQVNRYFYDATVSTQILWSYIRVTHTNDLVHILDRIEHKSGMMPLDLYLIFSGVTNDQAKEMIAQTIVHSPSRYRSIVLSYQGESILDSTDAEFWEHLRPLCTLHTALNPIRFSILNTGPEAGHLTFLPPLGSSLRSLHMKYCLLAWSAISFPDTLEALSLLEFGPSEFITATTILKCLGDSVRQSLRSLSLEGVNVQELQNMPEVSCVLHGLEELNLHNLYIYELVTLLGIIITPNITHLSLDRIHHGHLFPLLEASWNALRFPHLQKLAIKAFRVGDHRLINFIEHLPESVEYLVVSGDWGDDHVIKSLLEERSTGPFWSRLRHLTANGIPLHALVDLVERRCTSLLTLQVAFSKRTANERDALPRDQLAFYFSRLRSSVAGMRVLRDEEDPDGDNQTTLAFEQLVRQGVEDEQSGNVQDALN